MHQPITRGAMTANNGKAFADMRSPISHRTQTSLTLNSKFDVYVLIFSYLFLNI
jgi:hypothetical protein